MKKNNIYKAIMLVILTATITFIVTSIVMYNTTESTKIKYVSTDEVGATFKMFRNFIEKNYLGTMDEDAMLESAIKGYVAGLDDDYSEYITKEEMEEYMQDARGNYVGVGIYITKNTKTNQIVVLMPIKGSPAEAAGIKSGDVITKVDGTEYNGEQLSEASKALKSEAGTIAKIEVLRNDTEKLEFEVERKSIKVSHIEAKVLENDIGYMKVSTFDEGCYEEFKQNWEKLSSQNIKSLIIDLRNNGGGLVDQALKIADYITEKDSVLLYEVDKNGKELGYVFSVTNPEGYGGDVSLSVGVRDDGTVNGYETLSISETAGLGMKAKEPEFKSNFKNKKADKFEVVKDGSGKNDDSKVDAISGATITSRAVTSAVNSCVAYSKSLKGGN